jgi:hypothetical protein
MLFGNKYDNQRDRKEKDYRNKQLLEMVKTGKKEHVKPEEC